MITTTHSICQTYVMSQGLLLLYGKPYDGIVNFRHTQIIFDHWGASHTLPSPMVIFRTRMFKKPKGTLLQAEFTKISNGPKQDDDASFTSKKRQEQNKKGRK